MSFNCELEMNPEREILMFNPSEEDMKDFMKYYKKTILPSGAHRGGICLVRPPKNFKARESYQDIGSTPLQSKT